MGHDASVERRSVVFSGRVQGVGFRATARSIAADHRVSGWVRNEADGTVRLEVQGSPEEVQAYLRDLRRHRAWFIDRVEEFPGVPIEGEEGFVIRR